MTRILGTYTLAILCLLSAAPALQAVEKESKTDPNVVHAPELFQGLKYRMIGPYRGGRVTAVAGVPASPFTFYMGATGGGVWKTINAGESWVNVSDDSFAVGSIGAIAVAESDPNVVYVGTGSACPRGNVSAGDGVWKSTDAGKSWTHAGIPKAGQIARIRVHPGNADVVYAAVLGNIFGPNEERGVFRSRDGAKSWQKVLYVSERTGAVDLAMNPENPREMYAAMWRAERKPWTMIDGGKEGGLYKTTDGGEGWEKLSGSGGLPPQEDDEEGLIGRIGVTISPARPERVWALVTAKGDQGGLYRSDDAGESWKRISADRRLQGRGWYYTHVQADPADENTLYCMNAPFLKSIDAGKTFERIRTPHGDNHDLWINPDQPRIMVEGNDGGATVTLDGGATWSTLLNQPTAEFYRVTVDNAFPYRVYGAQQDNSTIAVPSRILGGTTPKEHWRDLAGGESGHIAVHPEFPELTYAGNYIGRIDRFDRRSGQVRNVILYPEMADGVAPRDLRYRFQWNAPILFSPHDPEVVYHTSNYVHRTRDGGMTWETISPDLTRDDPEKQALPGGPLQHDHTGVEVYNTVFALAESPHTKGVLWAGTDDGRVHLTRDDGATWSEVTPKQMPGEGTVNVIELSPHRAGRAFIAVYRYRVDDVRPYAFRTDDYGQSWVTLTTGSNGIPENHPLRVVREDPDRQGLLYAGTERGLFVSFDDGSHWQSLQLNLPATPVTDLSVYRKDLVVATQGRSFWVLDDLTPLHEVDDTVALSPLHLFSPRATVRAARAGGRFRGDRAPDAAPDGALLHYYLSEETAGPKPELTLEILDAEGETLRRYSSEPDEEESEKKDDGRDEEDEKKLLPKKQGMNRFVWDLKTEPLELVEGAVMSLGYEGGTFVPPGSYQARLTAGEVVQTRPLEVTKDPRLTDVTQEDLDAQYELLGRVRGKFDETHGAIRQLRSVSQQIEAATQRAEKAGIGDETIQELAAGITKALASVEEELIQTQNEDSQDPLNFPPKLDNQLVYLYGHVNGAYGRPTQGSYQRSDDLEALLQPHLDRLHEIFESDVAAFNAKLRDLGAAGVLVPKLEES